MKIIGWILFAFGWVVISASLFLRGFPMLTGLGIIFFGVLIWFGWKLAHRKK